MRMKGQINGQDVEVLVDSGATDNFISGRIAEILGLHITKRKRYEVLVGDGHAITSPGMCKGIKLKIQGIEVPEDFLWFDIGNTDVILGYKWLETLGETKINWKLRTLSFKKDEKWVTLHGNPSKDKSQVSLNTMMRTIRKVKQGVMVELTTMYTCEESDQPATDLKLQLVLDEYSEVFEEKNGLPPQRERDHGITLMEGSGPINVRPYRYPYIQKNAIEELIRDMLTAGIIRPSTSPFSSPVLLVRKKDGSWRFCVDYRALNKATIPDRFPIPTIDELLDELNGAVIFSKLDLRSGYHQIRVKTPNIEKTAFRTHEGHYEFLVMPFGLTNAPATFQPIMNDIFKGYLRKFVLVFFDDILIYSKSVEEHAYHLQLVLHILQQEHLTAKKKTCMFGQERIEYLGHVVTSEGVQVDHEKIKAVLEWPQLKTITELRGFLGLMGYYRKFVRGYGGVAWPLTQMLKKKIFFWTVEATKAFEVLKKKMTSTPVLALLDFSKEFLVETDACGYRVGAVLMQESRQ